MTKPIKISNSFAFLAGTVEEPTHLYLRCWMVPKHLKVPLTMMASRVQRASHSSILVAKQAQALFTFEWHNSTLLAERFTCASHSHIHAHIHTPQLGRRKFSEQPWAGRSRACGQAGAVVRVCLRRLCEADLCDVSTTARPSWMTLMMAFQRKRRECGSIPVVGSSCTNTRVGRRRGEPDEHKPNPYLRQHMAKDLKFMPVWMWLHAQPANVWEARGQARLNPYGRPSGSSHCHWEIPALKHPPRAKRR